MSVIERHSRVTLYYRLGLTDDQILEDNFDDSEVRIALNHSLAGQTVRYSVKIVAVENDPEQSETLY